MAASMLREIGLIGGAVYGIFALIIREMFQVAGMGGREYIFPYLGFVCVVGSISLLPVFLLLRLLARVEKEPRLTV